MRSQDKHHPSLPLPAPALTPPPAVPVPLSSPLAASQHRQLALQQSLGRLTKLLQREEKREALLQAEIEKIRKQLEEGEERSSHQAVDMDELTDISH